MLTAGSQSGLACAKTCLNAGDACICDVAVLPLLSAQQSRVLHYAHLALIGEPDNAALGLGSILEEISL